MPFDVYYGKLGTSQEMKTETGNKPAEISVYRNRCLWAFAGVVILLLLGYVEPADASDVGVGEVEMAFAQTNGRDFDIYHTRFTGSRWSEKVQLSHDDQDDMLPAISVGGNGVRWVVWGRGNVVDAKLFYAIGENGLWSAPQEIQSDFSFNHAPSIMVDSQNIPWVVWHADAGAGTDIFFTRWNGSGWEAPGRVNRQDGTPDILPLIGMDDDGKPWVCWRGYDGKTYRVYSSKWTDGRWGEETLSEKENLYEVLLEMGKKGELPKIPDFLDNPHQATMFIGRNRKLQSLPMRYVGFPAFSERTKATEGAVKGETADASGDLLIKAFGDSITQGYPYITEHGDGRRVGGYEPKLETLLNNASRPSQVFNWGWAGEGTVPSDGSVGGLNRIDSVLETGSSKYILILEGTNDPCWMVPVSDTIFNLDRLIDKSRTYNVEPILATLTPDTTSPPICGTKPIDSEYNPAIKNLASQRGVILADQYAAVIGNWASLTGDGLHPNDQGYQVMAQKWFAVIPPPPVVTTSDATSISYNSAKLNGTVNPKGLATSYHFEYGQTTAYGNYTPTTSAGSGTSAVPVSYSVTNLSPETLYHYRIVETSYGESVYGNDKTFTTLIPPPPVVTTSNATSISYKTATLNGTVNPNGYAASYHFEYGQTTTYGNYTLTTSAGSGASAVPVSYSITNLRPITLYHYRIVATGYGESVYGNDKTFTTTCSGDAVVLENVVFLSGATWNCTGTQSITVGPDTGMQEGSVVNFAAPQITTDGAVNIESGARVTFTAPKVMIGSGFNAKSGSVVDITH